jgi:proteasome regulatory subunit
VEEREEIFRIHTKNMNLDKVDLSYLASLTEGFSGAEIRSVCTEAGYFAIRNKKSKITSPNFISAIKKIKQEEDNKYKNMFG